VQASWSNGPPAPEACQFFAEIRLTNNPKIHLKR
jgi:hypothetical protein